MKTIFLTGTALFFIGMGILALMRPAAVLALFNINVTTPAGRNEVRAVYGGYGIMMGGLLFYSLSEPELQAGIWFTIALALLGMALGRLFSFLIDRAMSTMTFLFFVVEIIIALILTNA